MPTFRCYALTADQHIVWGEDMKAATPESAAELFAGTPKGQGAALIEVWLGEKRLHKLTPANASVLFPMKPNEMRI